MNQSLIIIFLCLCLVLSFLTIVILQIRYKRVLKSETESKIQNSKLITSGKFTPGITHELNNLMTPIQAYSELILMDIKIDDNSKKYLDCILESTSRATDIIQSLLSLSRDSGGQLNQNLVDIVSDFSNILKYSLHDSIQVNFKSEDTTYNVLIDKNHIEFILLVLSLEIQAYTKVGCSLYVELWGEQRHSKSYVKLQLANDYQHSEDETNSVLNSKCINELDPGLTMIKSIIKRYNGVMEVEYLGSRVPIFSLFFPL